MYGYDNYKKIQAETEARRTQAIAAADMRNAELRSLSPEIKEIDRELVTTGLRLFKAACEGKDITPIKDRNQELCKRRTEIMKALGYPEDYTEVHYSCPDCSDTGFCGDKMCRCFREALIKENIKSSGMGALIEKQSFENFDLNSYQDEKIRGEMQNIVSYCRRFAEKFGKASDTLVFVGGTGSGKTHLSTAIAKKVIEAGFEVLYDSAQNIVSAFENDRFKSGYGPYEPQGDKYLECDLLILDDLGAEFSNQFTVSCLYNLINTRQNKGLSTVISTNLTPKDFSAKYEDRIYSRVFGAGSTVFLFRGGDRRLY